MRRTAAKGWKLERLTDADLVQAKKRELTERPRRFQRVLLGPNLGPKDQPDLTRDCQARQTQLFDTRKQPDYDDRKSLLLKHYTHFICLGRTTVVAEADSAASPLYLFDTSTHSHEEPTWRAAITREFRSR